MWCSGEGYETRGQGTMHQNPAAMIISISLLLCRLLGLPIFLEGYHFVTPTFCHLIHDDTDMNLSITYLPCHYHNWNSTYQASRNVQAFILYTLFPGPTELMIISDSPPPLHPPPLLPLRLSVSSSSSSTCHYFKYEQWIQLLKFSVCQSHFRMRNSPALGFSSLLQVPVPFNCYPVEFWLFNLLPLAASAPFRWAGLCEP